MRKCAFIIPYYGTFPSYFQLFLNSCGKNDDYDWLIFTDNKTEYAYPENVHVYYETFDQMIDRVASHFDFDVRLATPYKLCDLKPMYGYLFSDYLQNYHSWGYCDCDLIFGKISNFITDDMLESFDKIFMLGHCSIIKNTRENNERFMSEYHGEKIYKNVLTSGQIFTFDESYLPNNVNDIFKETGAAIFQDDWSANTRARSLSFQITRYAHDLDTYLTEATRDALYVWNDGRLVRYSVRLGHFEQNELLYMHFQRRKMDVRLPVDEKIIKILPGSFERLEVDGVDSASFNRIKKKHLPDMIKHLYQIKKSDAVFWLKKLKNHFMA